MRQNENVNQPKILLSEFKKIQETEAPFAAFYNFDIESLEYGIVEVCLPYDVKHIRPGGTICGPAMFALADYAMWVAVLSVVGKVPLAVTTNLNINFLNKPQDTDLICKASIIKAGKRLMVGDMQIQAKGDDFLCAHATGTYSVPPVR